MHVVCPARTLGLECHCSFGDSSSSTHCGPSFVILFVSADNRKEKGGVVFASIKTDLPQTVDTYAAAVLTELGVEGAESICE